MKKPQTTDFFGHEFHATGVPAMIAFLFIALLPSLPGQVLFIAGLTFAVGAGLGVAAMRREADPALTEPRPEPEEQEPEPQGSDRR